MAFVSLAIVVVSAAVRLGMYKFADRFRSASTTRARVRLARWCAWALPRLSVRVDMEGRPFDETCIYMANHRTYLDILVLAQLLDAAFLSRGDLSDWPVIGAAARLTGAVFVERQSATGRTRAVRHLLRQLHRHSFTVFPEGTTTGDPFPAPFHSGLFRLARRAGVPIVPVTLRYNDRRAYWVEDLTMWRHLKERVLAGPPLHVIAHIGEPIHPTSFDSADELRTAVDLAIRRPIETCGELVSR
ncbi:MAG: 1-acyl-sn-glycerol-3-phosphate acyltransferase [Deltaproteobacteria bacterium]|nr:1-acyl-sn-glycerol-3-phosphate acyltransferase [Deltaproteobacteria bacterium]